MSFPIKIVFEDDPPEAPYVFRFGDKNREKRESTLEAETGEKKDTQKDFVLEWDKALGFGENPFSKDPSPASDFISGYQKERKKINLFLINENKFGVIHGAEGTGKTMLLTWLSEQLKQFPDKIEPVFIKGNIKNPQAVLSDIVSQLMNPYEKTVRKGKLKFTIDGFAVWIKKKVEKKKLVILIDGTKRVSVKDIQLFNILHKLINLIVVVAESKEIFNKSIFDKTPKMNDVDADNFKDALKINLDGLEFQESLEMLEKRIESVGGHGIAPFHETQLRSLHKNSKKNAKEFLALCKRKAIELSVKDEVSSSDLTKQIEEKEAKHEKEILDQEKEDHSNSESTPTQQGHDYKIEVVDRSEGTIVLEDDGKDKKKYTVKHD
tara:strand:- start:998 stop:2134 length:1137 start_codon:yes stop_codon:yes gene_type:complete